MAWTSVAERCTAAGAARACAPRALPVVLAVLVGTGAPAWAGHVPYDAEPPSATDAFELALRWSRLPAGPLVAASADLSPPQARSHAPGPFDSVIATGTPRDIGPWPFGALGALLLGAALAARLARAGAAQRGASKKT